MNTHHNLAKAATVLVALTSMVALSAPAMANDADKVRRGSCSGATDWKVKVKPDDGRLEVEGEVDSNHVGQTWSWRIIHNGSVSAKGVKKTTGPSGSFEVSRRLVNLKGTDTVTFRSTNVTTGELCLGTVKY